MADTNMADETRNQDNDAKDVEGVIPGLTVEARDERVHVWITPDFEVVQSKDVVNGVALSIEGFEVSKDTSLSHSKRARSFTLRLKIGSFVLEVPVKASFQGETERNGRATMLYGFTNVDNGERDALRRYIRAHLSGHVVTVDDVVRRQDMPTSSRGRTSNNGRNGNGRNNNASSNPVVRAVRGFFNLAVTLGVIAIIAFIGAFAIYDRVTVVRSHFAAITAPNVTMISPSAGQLTVSGPVAGHEVQRDDELVRIVSPSLDADLIRARAQARATNSGVARANVAALELEAAGNALYAPCDCRVLWAPENGGWVLEGDRLYTLVRTEQGDLRVEALVHVRDVDRLYRGQTAYISWPESDQISEGTIEFIALDGIRQSRAGFPDWLRQDQSLVSVMIVPSDPVDPDLIGHPVNVMVRTELPFLDRVKSIFATSDRSDER